MIFVTDPLPTGMTKVKFSKKEESGAAFVDKRRAALERSVDGWVWKRLL